MKNSAKKQHYVPQLLLKHFAIDERISVFDSERNLVRHKRKYKEEFAENYFYGKDDLVEKFLSDQIETPAATVINNFASQIIDHHQAPDPNLLKFLLVQFCRTPGGLSEALNAIDKFSETIILQLCNLNGFPQELASQVKVVPKDPKLLLKRLTVQAMLQWPLVKDLAQRLLINKTKVPFVLSDHPVVHYNWYLRECTNPSRTSLPAIGIQIFLPISPTATLCLYDKKIYKFKNHRSSITPVSNLDDINLLNRLQAMNREKMVVFSNEGQEGYVTALCKNNEPGSLHTSHGHATNPQAIQADQLKSNLSVWREQASFKSWLSVVSIRTKARAKQGVFCERSPKDVADHRVIMKLVDEDLRTRSHESLKPSPLHGLVASAMIEPSPRPGIDPA